MSFTETDIFSALRTGKHPAEAAHSFLATGQLLFTMVKKSVKNKSKLLLEQEDKLPLKTAPLVEHQIFSISRDTKKENT